MLLDRIGMFIRGNISQLRFTYFKVSNMEIDIDAWDNVIVTMEF
jgi:hypothetical protein